MTEFLDLGVPVLAACTVAMLAGGLVKGVVGIGLATDPISQPLELPDTRAELRVTCLGGELEPQIVLRVGWAPMSAAPLPSTGRRPVDETIDELDRPWR